MNILRIVYDWPNPWQGLAPHPYEITAAQLKAGHKVTLFCGQWPNSGGPVKLEGLEINAIDRELYPDTNFKLCYGRDFRALMLKYGGSDLVAALDRASGELSEVAKRQG